MVSKTWKFAVVAIAVDDRLAEAPLDFLGLALEHRRLVGDADFAKVEVRIEAGRVAIAQNVSRNACLVAAVADVVADVVDVGEGEHDEVLAVAILTERAGGGGAGFLVVGLAVDDRGDAVLGVSAHPPPDLHDIAAGGVDHVTTALVRPCP